MGEVNVIRGAREVKRSNMGRGKKRCQEKIGCCGEAIEQQTDSISTGQLLTRLRPIP